MSLRLLFDKDFLISSLFGEGTDYVICLEETVSFGCSLN